MKRKITQELVFELADVLSSQGIDPTNLKIREMNDNHGSLTSITPHLKQWREVRSAEGVEAMPDMPEEKLLQLLRPVWSELAREAKVLFADDKERIESKMADCQQQLTAIQHEVDRQDTVIEQNETLVAELRQQITAFTQQNGQLREQLASELAKVEGLSDKVSDKQDQITGLTEQLTDAKQSYNQLQATHDEACALHESELATMRRVHSEHNDDMTAQIQQLNDQVSEQSSLKDSAEAQFKDACTKLVDVNELRSQETKRADSQIADLQSRLDNQSDKFTTVTAQLAVANQRADSIAEQLTKLERRESEVLSRFFDTATTLQASLDNAKSEEDLMDLLDDKN